jgi:hypothetical protein
MAGVALGQNPKREILGFNLRMSQEDVRSRLKKIGTFVRAEKRQEAWQIRDATFSHIIVGFGKDEEVRYITAVARKDKDAERVNYGKVGNLKKARQAGDPTIKNFNYQWDLPAKGEDPGMMVVAIGRDPEFLQTLSLKRIGKPAREEDDD